MTATTDGITLLGSEMLTWSDLDGEAGGFGGVLAPHLLHGFTGARERVLVAGPTTAAVVLDVAGGFAATDVLVRSWLDAQQLREALPASIGVLCGPLDRVARLGVTYDAVVAVAGTDRLHSAEEDTPQVAAVLADLVGLLAEDGELYVGVGNPVGVDRLLSLGTSSRHHDAAWPDGHVTGEPAPTREAVLDLLTGTHGLTHVETWFCHGRRSAPLVAASAATLAQAGGDGVLTRLLAHAYDVADASAPVIKDPSATVRDLARAGLAAATAPLAVVHLGRTRAAAPAEPVVLVGEAGTRGLATRLRRADDGWTRDLLDDTAAATSDRDPAALVGAVPPGPTLAELLEEACAAHDVATAGVLVRRYADWLGAPGPTISPDRAAVLPGDVVVDGDALVLLDASWRTPARPSRDAVLLRGLLEVGADLLARGVRHPWSAAASPRVLATELAAAAGIEDAEPALTDALALDRRLVQDCLLTDAADAPAGLAGLTYAELVDVAQGLANRAAEADEHVTWLLKRVQGRQRALRAARGQIRSLNESREMRVGRKIFRIREALRQYRIRRALRRNGPAGEWKDRSGEPVEEPEVPYVLESDLVPPGYRPGADFEVVEPEPED